MRDILGCGKLIVCVSHSRWLKYSLTQVHKAQEHKRQVASYELLFLEICVLFLTNACVILITFTAPGAWLAPEGSGSQTLLRVPSEKRSR